MQACRALVLALLVSAKVAASNESSEDKVYKEFTCYADIDGFPKISSSTSLNAETVLSRVNAQSNISFGGKELAFGTRKFDECPEDSFGKLSIGSMKELFRLVDLTPKDSFVDLGSGLGEVPITAAVLSGVHHATGVELSRERHKSACEGLAKLEGELKGDSSSTSMVELMQGDMLKVDLSDDTVVFTNSYCLRRHLLDKLAEKLAMELPEGARIASTKAFRDLPPRLAQVSKTPLEIGEGISVSIYEVTGPRPPKGQKRKAVRMSKKQKEERAAALKARKQALKQRVSTQAEKTHSLLSRAFHRK